MNSDPKMLAAAQWYGYGRWDAPYWFVGKEPGGTDDPEQYASWARLGEPELLDCRAHDLDCASTGARRQCGTATCHACSRHGDH